MDYLAHGGSKPRSSCAWPGPMQGPAPRAAPDRGATGRV